MKEDNNKQIKNNVALNSLQSDGNISFVVDTKIYPLELISK